MTMPLSMSNESFSLKESLERAALTGAAAAAMVMLYYKGGTGGRIETRVFGILPATDLSMPVLYGLSSALGSLATDGVHQFVFDKLPIDQVSSHNNIYWMEIGASALLSLAAIYAMRPGPVNPLTFTGVKMPLLVGAASAIIGVNATEMLHQNGWL